MRPHYLSARAAPHGSAGLLPSGKLLRPARASTAAGLRLGARHHLEALLAVAIVDDRALEAGAHRVADLIVARHLAPAFGRRILVDAVEAVCKALDDREQERPARPQGRKGRRRIGGDRIMEWKPHDMCE